MVKGKVSHLHMLINDLFIVNEVDKFKTSLYFKKADCEGPCGGNHKILEKESLYSPR